MNKDKEVKLFLQEFDEKPYHKFNIAFSLMALLPILVTFYIIVNKLFSLEFLRGNVGLILFISIFISICGYLIGYKIISDMLKKIIFYAAKAKRADQLKSILIASVSHEFKNPLGALKLCLFDMTDGLVDQMNHTQKEMLSRCNNIIDRLNRLVNDLLDVYKIEAGMITINRKLCNLPVLLERQIKEFENILVKNQIKLNLIKENESKYLSIWADEDKIVLVINNLLSNAVKYTPLHGLITVKINQVDEFVRLEFQDSGKGIPSDKLEKIFDKFKKVDISKEGTGLGLAISKDIVELHGGKIWAESKLEAGSRFIVLLPRSLRQT